MGRRRVTGRFYVVMAIVAAIAFFVIRQTSSAGYRLAVVEMGAVSDTRRLQAVIVRNETVGMVDGNSTVYYLVDEGAYVAADEEIAEAYTAGYSIKEISNLEKIRKDIRAHHAEILNNIVDPELDRLNGNVARRALELKMLLNGNVDGNFANIEKQLIEAMRLRQQYLSQNRREDSRLTTLYDEEVKQVQRIVNWRQVQKADRAGVVSFYLDGREQFLSPSQIESVTAAQLRDIMSGWRPDVEQTSRQQRPAFRLVDQAPWYLLLLVRAGEIDAEDGQQFRFQLEGFPDVIHTANVQGVTPSGRDVIITLRVTDPMGPLLNQRSGWVVVSADMTGLSVPNSAIVYQYEQSGVMRYDGANGVFVAVQILTRDGSNALIRPVSEEGLWRGAQVIIH